MEFSNFNKQAKQTSYRHGNLYEVGSYVQNADGDVGKIHRRGPNYVIAVTEDGDMFRAWVSDIKEYKQWNTSGADQSHRLVGTDKFRKFTERMTPGSEYDMWKKPAEVHQRINKTKPIKEETMTANVRLSAWMLGLNLTEQQEIASKMDRILLSGEVVEGILESFGTERMQDLATEYASIVSGEDLSEGMKQARANVGASKCWDGYTAKGTKKKDGKEVPNCVKEEEEDLEEGKKGLYANIHAKRKRGESPAKPGDDDYPAKDAFKKAAKTAKEEVETEDDLVENPLAIGAALGIAAGGAFLAKKAAEAGKAMRNKKQSALDAARGLKNSYEAEGDLLDEKKKLDPVGKEDGDVDNDGDKDSSDSYLLKRRAAVSAAIKAKKGTKKESFSDWRTELLEKDVKGVEVNPQIDDATDPMSVFDKNKKLKGANNMKEECGTCSEKEDCGCETCLAKKASKVKRVKYQDGVNEEVDKKKKEDIVKGMKKNMGDLKARYGDKAKQVMYATATKNAKK